jgi:putative transposase
MLPCPQGGQPIEVPDAVYADPGTFLQVEFLVLRHENAVLRRQIGRVRYEPLSSRRPSTAAAIRKIVIRIAAENPVWGHRLVQGEMVRLGHPIAASTVWRILHDSGIDPAPRRTGPTWEQFLTQA